MNMSWGAMACRSMPQRSASRTAVSMTPQMCSTSRRVPWNALFAKTVDSNWAIGWTPRSRAASADSRTTAAAPEPMIMPCRRRSNGRAASSTRASVAAAPVAMNPVPIHGMRLSLLTSSAETTITRRQRPERIQSSATPMAWVVLAQAALSCVLGPRAPMISANWECPMDSTRKRKRRSNSNGRASISALSWARSASISATAAGSDSRVRAPSRATMCSRRALSST